MHLAISPPACVCVCVESDVMDKLLKIVWQALIRFELCLAGSSQNKATSERLADLLCRFGDWPGGVGGQGDPCPTWKCSRGLFL